MNNEVKVSLSLDNTKVSIDNQEHLSRKISETLETQHEVDGNRRHLSNIDCLMAHTTCLVCFISTVNGSSKKALEDWH